MLSSLGAVDQTIAKVPVRKRSQLRVFLFWKPEIEQTVAKVPVWQKSVSSVFLVLPPSSLVFFRSCAGVLFGLVL